MEDLLFILACALGVSVICIAGFILGMLHGEKETLKKINGKLKNKTQ